MPLDTSDLKLVREHIPTLTVGYRNADFIIDGTNDDIQINAALNSLPNGIGKVTLKVEGTVNLGTSVIMSGYQWLEGMGQGITTIKAKSGMNADIIYTQTSTFNRYLRISDLALDGNRANNTSGRGIYLYAPRNCVIENVWIKETDDDAIRFSGTSGTLGWYNWIRNSEIDNCDNGIKIFGYCEHNYIDKNTITFIGGNGVFADSDQDHITGNKFDECTSAAINLEFGAGAWFVHGNSFDNGHDHDIVLRSAHKTDISNNFFGGAAAGKAHIMNGPNGNDVSGTVLISGNRMTETGGTGTFGIREGGSTDRCRYVNNIITGPTTPLSTNGSSTNLVSGTANNTV